VPRAEDLTTTGQQKELVEPEGFHHFGHVHAHGEAASGIGIRAGLQVGEHAVDERVAAAERAELLRQISELAAELAGELVAHPAKVLLKMDLLLSPPGFSHEIAERRGRKDRENRGRDQQALTQRHRR